MKLPNIKDHNFSEKKVFLRLDLDVPLSDGSISDDSRLTAGLESLHFLLKQNAKVIVAGHLGRPNGFDPKFSLKPIAEWFATKLSLQLEPSKTNEFDCFNIGENLILLENLRFYPQEESNDVDFARRLASLANIYVNDAFGASHRNHTSIVGVARLLPHFAGLRLEKEIETLSKVLENPQRPFIIVIGGEKIETKLPLVDKMVNFADNVLVGGEIATEITDVEGVKPNLIVAVLNNEKTDINSDDVQKFKGVIKTAKTIVWNGPMGIIQKDETKIGTKEIANSIAQTSAFTIVGGGNTVGFLKDIELLNRFSFVSTGGGAMLEFLSGEKLSGIEALVS